MHIGTFTLTDDEIAQWTDIKDKYNASKKVMEETVERSMNNYWNAIREKYKLHNCPMHVSGNEVWFLADATEEEQGKWMNLFKRK